jgi:hypothetical protein
MSYITSLTSELPQLPSLPEIIMPAIKGLTEALKIPREVLASDEDILYAWRDLPRELHSIPISLRDELIARMCIAVSTGLFDSAINYAWNASILQLRQKIRNFGLPVVAQTLQRDFEENHLIDLLDSQIIDLCLKLNLINEDGNFFLDQCRNIRNNFSAAHPTIGQINDREFINFLNRCVKYALADSSSPKGIHIGVFISAVKGSRFTDGQCSAWIEKLDATHDAQRELLFGMVHGIYCDPDTSEPARLNIIDLCGSYEEKFTSPIRSNLINKHSEYLEKGDKSRHTKSLQFFEKINSLSFLNENEKHSIISRATERLWAVHQEFNNFHNEPPFAERLCQISQQGARPQTVQEEYVKTIIGCYIGNGFGVSRGAVSYYEEMIKSFAPREIQLMVRIPRGASSVSRQITSNASSRARFRNALRLIDSSSVPDSVRSEYDSLTK